MAGASNAAAIQNRMMHAPTDAGVDSVIRPMRRTHVRMALARTCSWPVERTSAGAGMAIGASGPDPRVEHHVREIAQDLGQHRDADGHKRADRQERHALYEGHVQHPT